MTVVLQKKSERKKLYWLGGLSLVAAFLLWSSLGSDQASAPTAGESARSTPPAVPADPAAPPAQRRGTGARAGAEFRPRLGSKRPEDRIDPNKVDPTLRLDLLAKVQSVTLEGGARNLFQFGAAAPPVPTTPIPKVGKVLPVNGTPIAAAPPPVNLGPPPAPPAPPIPLKYYGFSNAKGEPRKKAFFLDGEDILVAREGETLKSRYKIVRIGVNSVEMEDTQFKSKQTLPLEAEFVG